MVYKERNPWLLVVLLIAGMALGGFIGDIIGRSSDVPFLQSGQEFGIINPVVLDLNVLKLTFGVSVRFNIMSALGILAAVFVYNKI